MIDEALTNPAKYVAISVVVCLLSVHVFPCQVSALCVLHRRGPAAGGACVRGEHFIAGEPPGERRRLGAGRHERRGPGRLQHSRAGVRLPVVCLFCSVC